MPARPTRRRWRSSSATRAIPSRTVGDMRALMASVGARRAAHRGDRRALRRRRRGRRACASSFARTREAGARQARARPSTYGTHRFTDAIDSDGHGNGPFHHPAGADREHARRRRPLHLRRHRDRRPVARAGEPADESRRARAWRCRCSTSAAIRRRSATPAARRRSTRCGCARARCCGRRLPAPLGMRGLTLMRFLAALNGLINVAGGKAPAAHSAYVISFMRGTYRTPRASSSRS